MRSPKAAAKVAENLDSNRSWVWHWDWRQDRMLWLEFELKLRLSAHTKSSESLTKIRHKQAPTHMCRTCPTVYSALARVHGYLHECTHLPLYHSPSTSPHSPGKPAISLWVCALAKVKKAAAQNGVGCSTTPLRVAPPPRFP